MEEKTIQVFVHVPGDMAPALTDELSAVLRKEIAARMWEYGIAAPVFVNRGEEFYLKDGALYAQADAMRGGDFKVAAIDPAIERPELLVLLLNGHIRRLYEEIKECEDPNFIVGSLHPDSSFEKNESLLERLRAESQQGSYSAGAPSVPSVQRKPHFTLFEPNGDPLGLREHLGPFVTLKKLQEMVEDYAALNDNFTITGMLDDLAVRYSPTAYMVARAVLRKRGLTDTLVMNETTAVREFFWTRRAPRGWQPSATA